MQVGYYCIYLVAWITLSILSLIPLSVLRALANGVGSLAFRLFRKKRKLALDNLDRAFGDEKTGVEKRAIALRAMQNMVFIYLEFVYFAHRKERLENYYYFDEASSSRVKAVSDPSRGGMYLVAHLGNWEMLALCSGRVGQQITGIGRNVKNKYLMGYVNRLRGATNSNMVEKDNAVKEAMKVLRQGNVIATLVDQRAGNTGVVVEFFGKPVTSTPFPALMKLKYDCRLFPTFGIREKTGYFHIAILDEIMIPEGVEDKQEKIKIMTQQYTTAVEQMVREYPEQWLCWYHNRWRL